jgi:hypothetical protein
MKSISLTTKTTISLIIGLFLSATALADNFQLKDRFQRVSPTAQSGSGHTVTAECGGAFDGSDYPDQRPARAKLKVFQLYDATKVKIVLRKGRPNTLHTVWLRVQGNDLDGNSFGGSPLTNGAATPLAPGHALDELEAISPWNSSGSATLTNGFTTNGEGKGKLVIWLDFPLIGGVYPFNRLSAGSLGNIRSLSNANAVATPTAIVDPRENGVDGPFLIRIVSHCQDELGHGLSPANREAWFDFPN